jgi:spore coat protein U-like protein
MPMKTLTGFAIGLGLLLAVLCWPRPAQALNLCLLNCSCGVSTALVTFGSYDALSGSPVTAAGNVQVSCQLLSGSVAQVVAFNVGLSTGGSGAFGTRTMARVGGGGSLGYNLYSDGGMATIWGDGTGGTQQQGGVIVALLVGTPVVANYPVYGKVPASQQVRGGSYSDTITVSMSF